jgi:succinate dehydrogenase/fumarate reductase flavoprotein subunit/2,4-dienoyl-CoA reductase-like NADH-dependent reductase (Old Yellow Enzyme family)
MAKHEKFHYKSAGEIIDRAKELNIDLPWSGLVDPLLQPAFIRGIRVPNRLAVQPMEGFDADDKGMPGDLAFRRYGRYAAGGSGMIWFEAASVLADGRSNPHQMMITDDTLEQFKKLTEHVRKVAEETYGPAHRPFLVLQLTHSGRYSKPGGNFQPKIFSDNPYLDPPHPPTPSPALASLTGEGEHRGVPETPHPTPDTPYPIPDTRHPIPVFYSDSDIDAVKAAYIHGVELAELAGFDAVDVKACHGYLLHEMLYAFDRTDSRYGGSYENRTRFLREVLNVPSKIIKAVRLSGFDLIPYPYGFGMNSDGSAAIDLLEVKKLIAEFAPIVPLWNITAGVPRLAAHVGRPYDRGAFNSPPPDEHPLQGVARLIGITGQLQQTFPDLFFVGTGYSWLRQFYPHVGAGVLEKKMASFIGLGRSSFAYPDSPRDLMDKGILDPKKVCVSCSKCTEFMRQGGPAGCGVRDAEYKGSRLKAQGSGEGSRLKAQGSGEGSRLKAQGSSEGSRHKAQGSGEGSRLKAQGASEGSRHKFQGSGQEFLTNPRLQSGGGPYSVSVLIIGSGAAALNAALCLWESGVHDIVIVTEKWGGGTSNNAGSDKQTYYKMSLDPGVPDSAGEMAVDLCHGGAMHGDIALCEAQHSIRSFYNLVRLGVPFPHDRYGSYPGYKTDHDPRARATSTGPLTSHLMFKCLARKVRDYGIPVHDHIVITELLTGDESDGKVITGAAGFDQTKLSEAGNGFVIYSAKNVILATGGPAGIYKQSVYPESQTGSIGMALKIGAKAQNLSISQFGIASVKFRWNLSGSYQQVIPRYYSTDQNGTEEREFLNTHFPDIESLSTAIFLKGYQWPFDPKKVNNFGSSLIDLLVQNETAVVRKVYIDFTRNPDGFHLDMLQPVAREYLERSGALAANPIERLTLMNQPAIDLYKSHGIDITSEPLEIAVCAQHNNGGLVGDIWWESNIRGLFPIGEVNGSHGITRPGGAALNAGQVGGIRAAMRIVTRHPSPVTSHPSPVTRHPSPVSCHTLLAGKGTLDHLEALAELKQRMSEHGGPVRNRITIKAEVEKAWNLWYRLNSEIKAVNPAELVTALRTFDLCLTHAVYLESIAEYLDKSEDELFTQRNILEIYLDENLKVQKNWVPVRPVPNEELWFEQVWKQYISSTNDEK